MFRIEHISELFEGNKASMFQEFVLNEAESADNQLLTELYQTLVHKLSEYMEGTDLPMVYVMLAGLLLANTAYNHVLIVYGMEEE